MTVGFVMLAHNTLDRAAQVIKALQGLPSVVHVDQHANQDEFENFSTQVANCDNVTIAERQPCDWGTWSLVQASRRSAKLLLEKHPSVGHVKLISGTCLPIRPVSELRTFLSSHPNTDFIESVTIEDAPWTKGGLSQERFDFTFPFAWKRQRLLFDAWVSIQRKLGRERPLPKNLKPHLGSQWWCLTRRTIEKVFSDPDREEFDRYFRSVWIPDESYFQSLVRYYGTQVESRSLTLSKFDFQGRSHYFYDDHLKLLQQSPAFFARKIWPNSERLYETFLNAHELDQATGPSQPVDQTFDDAAIQRTKGRPGLVMAARYPASGFDNGLTAGPYAVLQGFTEIFHDFPDWLSQKIGTRVHGHIFHEEGAKFADASTVFAGNLSQSACLRDYDAKSFLRNLIWNTRGEHQSFMYAPGDNQSVNDFIADDGNATVAVVSGAWALPLFHSNRPIEELRVEAAKLQKIEAWFLNRLSDRHARARLLSWTLAEFLNHPLGPLQEISDALCDEEPQIINDIPPIKRISGLAEFLQELRDAGMNPHLAGTISDMPKLQNNVTRLKTN